MENKITLELSQEEKIKCLEEILKKIKKILFVYEKSLDKESGYNYKIYITGILFYIKSSDDLFGGGLVTIMINLNSILINDLNKTQIKRIVLETKNFVEYLLDHESKKRGDENACN